MTKFNLSIDLFTEDVHDAADGADALHSVADRLSKFVSQPWSPYALSGALRQAPHRRVERRHRGRARRLAITVETEHDEA